MVSDPLLPAVVAYMATLLYNPNNVSNESSPATTKLEMEAAQDLAKMVGYDPEKAWGHITSGGHVANYEGIWVARNLKSIPFAVKRMRPEMVTGLDEWGLSNLSLEETLELIDRAKDLKLIDPILEASVRGQGLGEFKLGKILIPQTKHYSWSKAADLLGLGHHNLMSIRVKSDFRMDIDDLRKRIDELIRQSFPILAVVAVLGTTEEGAVDEIDKIVEIREHFRKKAGLFFSIHVDAAYGGYARAI
ncbi:MAG: tyrosine decarboxylase, partial [Deltaproteobacteria bacterium]